MLILKYVFATKPTQTANQSVARRVKMGTAMAICGSLLMESNISPITASVAPMPPGIKEAAPAKMLMAYIVSARLNATGNPILSSIR